MPGRFLPVTLFLIAALAAAGIFMHLTRDGVLINDDSVRYFMGAENLAAGNGYVRLSGDGSEKPIVGFPPGYSILLSPFLLMGIDKMAAARILSVLFFGANTFLAGWLVYRYSRKVWLGLMVCLAFAGKSGVLIYHYLAATEPAYIFLSLLSLSVLARYLHTSKRLYLVLLVSVLGFAPLVRYNAINLLPLAVLTILFFSKQPLSKRILHAVLAAAVGLVPLGVWMGRNMLLSGSSTNRTFMYHPIPALMLVEYVDEGISWFLPAVLQLTWRPRLSHLAVFLAVTSLFIVISEIRRLRQVDQINSSSQPYQALSLFSLGFIISHIMIVLLTTSFLDATMSAYARYMMPVYVFAVILIACLMAQMLENRGAVRAAGILGIGLWITLAGFHIRESMIEVVNFRETNNFRAMLDWEEGAGDYLRSLSSSTVLISDDINLVYVLSGRYAFMIPIRIDNYTLLEREDYAHQLSSHHRRMENGAVLVLTNNFIHSLDDRYASLDELTEDLELIYEETIVKLYRNSTITD